MCAGVCIRGPALIRSGNYTWADDLLPRESRGSRIGPWRRGENGEAIAYGD